MAVQHTPKFLPGASVTFTAEEEVEGGQIAAVGSADRSAKTAGAGDIGIGTFAFTAAAGHPVTVHLGCLVDRIEAAGPIAAGAEVQPAAAGRAQTLGEDGNRFGVALTAAADEGDLIELARI